MFCPSLTRDLVNYKNNPSHPVQIWILTLWVFYDRFFPTYSPCESISLGFKDKRCSQGFTYPNRLLHLRRDLGQDRTIYIFLHNIFIRTSVRYKRTYQIGLRPPLIIVPEITFVKQRLPKNFPFPIFLECGVWYPNF